VLLLSRTPEADRRVKVQFEARDTVTKRYVAISWGSRGPGAFLIDSPLMLDPDAKYKVKMRIAAAGEGLTAGAGGEALEVRRHPETGRHYTLIRCTLLTGRQHQIRLHLSSVGLPIVGDKLYGPDDGLFARGVDECLTEEDRQLLELPRHALHAAELS